MPTVGSKLLPVTPVPDHVPPAGVPTRFAAGSPGQNDPKAFADRSNINTSNKLKLKFA